MGFKVKSNISINRVVEAHLKVSVSSEHSTALMKWMSNAVRQFSPKIGENVYVVGGAVRNFVIDQPVKDVDMVIDSQAAGRDSAWLATQLARLIPAQTEVITDNYGVGKIVVKSEWFVDGLDLSEFSVDGDAAIEIANARAETYSDDTGGGYKPNVEWSGIEEDVMRRDFTFNTLMWRLSDLADGPDKAEIIDMTGCGLDDLKAGEARCPLDPDQTFHDDPTRMLRAIKFMVKYGLKIPNDTAASIKKMKMSLLKVSPDRVFPELEKILDEDKWKATLEQIARLGLADPIKEMLQTHKGFATRFKSLAAKRPVRFFLSLVDLGLPVRHDLARLDAEAKKRVWDLSFQMSREEQDQWVAALANPSGVIKDRNFFPSLAEKQGLRDKRSKGMFMGKATQIARDIILEQPEIVEDRNALMKEIGRRVSSMGRTAGKYDHIDFKPPESVANAAAKGLEYRQKATPSNRGGLTNSEAAKEGIGSGVQRAVNLKNRNNVTPETISKMVGFFARHEKNKGIKPENKGKPYNDKGHVAWLLWGGDPGKAWCSKIKKQMETADSKKAGQNLLPIMSPKFNLREVVKQCVLLEDHLFHPKKRCADCIAKHFLTIEALLEEAKTLDKKGEIDWVNLSGLADRVRLLQMAWVDGVSHTWIAQAIRAMRKSFNPSVLLDIRKASAELVLLRSTGCTHQATKSYAENEDEQTNRLVKKSPKKKPPRKDLKKNKVDVEKDPDIEDLGAEGDRDLSLNYKRIARIWLMAEDEPEETGEESPDNEGEGEGEEENVDPERKEIQTQEDIPEALQNLLNIEDFQDEDGEIPANLFITGPVDGEYTISIEHENGSKDEVKADPQTEEGLDKLISFPNLVHQHIEVNEQEQVQQNAKTRKKIFNRIKNQIPELAERIDEELLLEAEDFDHQGFKDSYDAQKEFLKNNPMSIPEARVSLNGEAVVELFENSDSAPATLLGELLARADNARKVHFNPGQDLSKGGIKESISQDDYFSQAFAALEYSSPYEPSDREVLVSALESEQENLDSSELRHQEISARIQGHQLSSILNKQDFPSENPPSDQLAQLIVGLSEVEDGKSLFCSNIHDWGSTEFRESVKNISKDLSEDAFKSLFDKDSVGGMVCKKVSQALETDERETLKDWSLELCLDQVTIYDVLLREIDTDDDFSSKCEELVEDAFKHLRTQEEDPSDICNDLRQSISELFLSTYAIESENLSENYFMLYDKIRNHAEQGGVSVLSQKTNPTTPPLFGGD